MPYYEERVYLFSREYLRYPSHSVSLFYRDNTGDRVAQIHVCDMGEWVQNSYYLDYQPASNYDASVVLSCVKFYISLLSEQSSESSDNLLL